MKMCEQISKKTEPEYNSKSLNCKKPREGQENAKIKQKKLQKYNNGLNILNFSVICPMKKIINTNKTLVSWYLKIP